MKELKIKQVIKAVDGRKIGIKNPDECTGGVSVDSRTIKENEIFFAIRGEKYDGHDFVDEAIKKSGAPAVVSKKVRKDNIILVDDTLKALGQLASFYRDYIDPFVIAVTGSVGKTTTKEFIGNIFSMYKPTLVSWKNYNNLIGVPLNIFRLEDEEYAVLELASNQRGEIKRLSEIAKPDIAVITSIGESHLESFHNREGVLEEKRDITTALKDKLFVNGDDDMLRSLNHNTVKVGFSSDNDYKFKKMQEALNGSIFAYDDREFYIKLSSPGALRSAIIATAIALKSKIPEDKIQKGLCNVKPLPHRLEIKYTDRITVIDDTYNSNPDSLMNALSLLKKFFGRRIAVLGPMLELGENSPAIHRKCGEKLQGLVNELIVVGEEAEGFLEGYGEGKLVKNKEKAEEELIKMVEPGDKILFKSSHLLRMETLVENFMEAKCYTSYTR